MMAYVNTPYQVTETLVPLTHAALMLETGEGWSAWQSRVWRGGPTGFKRSVMRQARG